MDPSDVSWHDRKASANWAKHHITFLDAKAALRDPGVRVWVDAEHEPLGDRFHHLGLDWHGRLLFLVTEQKPDGTIRLISARRATKREEHAYTTGFR